MRDLQSLVGEQLWDQLFDAPDESARAKAFVELVRSSCDLGSCSLWRQLGDLGQWWPVVRAGSPFDEREGLLVAALASGCPASISLPDVSARGPFGATSSPWFLSLVGTLEEECEDLVDALAVLWERVGSRTADASDLIQGPRVDSTRIDRDETLPSQHDNT